MAGDWVGGARVGPQPAAEGWLDVTEYGADPSGETDSTKSLQATIRAAFASNFAVFFPPGRYLVSETLTVSQENWRTDDGGVNIVPARFRPNVLVGSTKGLKGGGQRPTIVLAPDSPGFGNASEPKNVMKITNPAAENINMNQVIRGIDFEVQEGNSGAIALYFHGAQGGTTQDVTVTMKSGFAGFGGGGGAGASHVNVKVVGGSYGVYFDNSEPVPLVGSVSLINQTVSALHWSSQQTMVVVGAHIVQSAQATGPVVTVTSHGSPLTFVDSIVECHARNAVAVESQASLYIRDVYVRGCKTLVSQPGADNLLPSTDSVWTRIQEVASGVDWWNGGAGAPEVMNVSYVDGARLPGHTLRTVVAVEAADVPSPLEVLMKHGWDDAQFPAIEDEDAANAIKDCGAKGDGVTDDTDALQTCIGAHKKVFLPKGYYRLSATLELRAGTSLMGLSQTLSVIMPATDGFKGMSSSDEPQPLVRTATGEPVVISFLGINSWFHLPLYTMDWRAKQGVWRMNYETRVEECLWLNNYRSQVESPTCKPSVVLNVAKTQIRGTGRFFNFVNDEDILFTDHRNYRHVLVTDVNSSGADDRVSFYELNLEHAMSQANMEVRSAEHVDIFGLKVEGSNTILWVRDSRDVTLFGLGGGADGFPDTSYYPDDFEKYAPSIIRVERTAPYKFINLCDTGRGNEGKPIEPIARFPLTKDVVSIYDWPQDEIPKVIESMWAPWPGYAVPPSKWHCLLEADGPVGSEKGWSDVNDKPVLYARTTADGPSILV